MDRIIGSDQLHDQLKGVEVSGAKKRTDAEQAEYDQGYRDGGEAYADSKDVPERPDGVHPSSIQIQAIPDLDELLEGESVHYRDGFEDGWHDAHEADD